MNIEDMKAAVESILEREIDPTVWDRFARACHWENEVARLLAQLYADAERHIIETLSEIDPTEEAEAPISFRGDGKFAAWQAQEMFRELEAVAGGEIRNRLREVPGLTELLAAHFCRPGGTLDDWFDEAELQAWGQKAVPGPLAGLRTEDVMARLRARTATRDAGLQTQNADASEIDADNLEVEGAEHDDD